MNSFTYLKIKLNVIVSAALGIYRKPYFKTALIAYGVIMLPLIYMSVRRNMAVEVEEEVELDDMLPMVSVMRTVQEDFRDTLSIIGTVRGASEVNLRFEIEGRVQGFNFREGQNVRQGEVLVSLDPDDVMNRLDHARAERDSISAQLESAREQYEVHRELYEMGAIIRARLREVELNVRSLESQFQKASSEVNMARSQLEKSVITSPTSGIMGEKEVGSGDYVTPHDKVGTFIEVEHVYVEAGVIEREIQKIAEGQEVIITLDAYPDREFEGIVDNVSRMVRGEARTLPIEIKLPNPDRHLYSGMLANCELILQQFKDAITVPTESIIDLQEMKVVPVVKMESEDTGEIELRKVKPGYSSGDITVIEEGLQPGELLVKETQQSLRDGMRVKVVDIEEPEGR